MTKRMKFIRNQNAHAAIEFALLLPVLLLLLYGVVEISRYAYFLKKLESSSSQLSNVLGQYFDASSIDLDDIYDASKLMFEPFDGDNLTIVLTTYKKTDPDPASVRMEAIIQTTRGPAVTSRLAPKADCGGVGPNPDCSVTLGLIQFKEGDIANSVEVFAKYNPAITYFTGAGSIVDFSPSFYRKTIYRARYSSFKK